MLSVSMPNSATPSALVETATKCLAIASSDPSFASAHSRGRAGVGHRLEGGEGLRGDDEERLLGVEVPGLLDEVGAVDVGDEAEGHLAARVVAQRLVGHHRPEVRAADADVDHVADRLARVSLPLARADPLGEGRHPVEHLVDLLDDVLAVDDQRTVPRHPQRDVEHGAVLGDVDVLAAEHRVPPLGHPALVGELGQQLQRLVGDPVLRVVEEEPGALGDQPRAAVGVLREQLTQVPVPDLAVVLLEGLPGRALAQLRFRRHAPQPNYAGPLAPASASSSCTSSSATLAARFFFFLHFFFVVAGACA